MIKKLSEPIDINNFETSREVEDYIYDIFKSELMDKNKRGKLYNEFVFMDIRKWSTGRPDTFWHLISLQENERFNIFPCNNDYSYTICNENCFEGENKIELSNGQKRNICYYRAIRIIWINEIINLANKNDFRIKRWVVDGKLHIRYTYGEVDYILIFVDRDSKGKNYYYFITAFPIFYINSKKKYDEDYNDYKK